LACRGIQWQREALINALMQGDLKTVAQFVKGGWKLGSDEFFHLLRNDSVRPEAMQPIVDCKAVTGFEFCQGYKELAQIVGLPAPISMPDGSVHFKTLDDAYLQNIEELSRDPARWALFTTICDASALRQHYDDLIAAEERQIAASQEHEKHEASPATAEACKGSLRKKFPLLDLVNNPRAPDPTQLTYTKEDEFLANFQMLVMFGSGSSRSVQAVYDEALSKTCRPSSPPGPRAIVRGVRLERLQAIRRVVP